MAKQTKSGLGRGLSSLLGDTLYESFSPAQEKLRELHQQPETIIDESRVDEAPVRERAVNRESETSEVKKNTSHVQEVDAHTKENKSVREQVGAEKVVIKDLIERKSDEVSIDLVRPNPDQPRTLFKGEELEELAQSIQKNGLLQPILVRPYNGSYQIIAGERRWQACKKAGIKAVPIRIKEADNTQALELALIENIQRSNLNPIEEAYGYKRLMEKQGMTQSEIAQKVSKGRSTIANSLRLLELPEDAQQLLFEEKITAGHARAILSVTTPGGREKLTQKLLKTRLSVREAEALARLINLGGQGQKIQESTKPKLPSSYKRLAKKLRQSLGTDVKIKNKQGKTKLEIEFYSEEELEKLCNSLKQLGKLNPEELR